VIVRLYRAAGVNKVASPKVLLKRFGLPAGLILLAFLFPLVNEILGANLMFPVIVVAVYVMLALGLNIVVGFAGLLDLGFVAFYALGAYVVGWLASTHFSGVSFSLLSALPAQTSGRELPGIHVSFWLLLLAAGAFAGLWGVIIGAPTLRLRGDYLAIVTLGFGEIIPRLFVNGDNIFGYNLTNGTVGIKGIDSPGIPFVPSKAWQQFGTLDLSPWYYTILVLVLITIFVNIRLRDSRLGRAWVAVREDETAAAAMGVNLVTTKLWAYALGAVFGGLAGAFYGAFIKSIFPSSFSFNVSVLVLCMVILGGMGNIYGVILGAIMLQGINFYLLPQVNEWVHAIGDALSSPLLSNADIPKYNFFLFGVLLVVMMLLRPEGIIPNRQRQEELREEDETLVETAGA
jgi:branched-chain amino acid transport system permease protein